MKDHNLNKNKATEVVNNVEPEITTESPKLRGVYSEFMEQLDAREEEAKDEPLGKAKTSFKINIVDISHKKEPHNKTNYVKNKVEQFGKKETDRFFDSLIYLGGGFLALTTITSKNLSDLGTFLINKK